MKKLLLIVFLFSMIISVNAQNGIRVGLTASPLVSWMSSQDNILDGAGTGFGFTYGLLFDFAFGDNYAISTGLDVLHTNTSLTYLDSATKFNTFGDEIYFAATQVDYHLQYIEIPLAFKLKTNEIGYITYFGQFGLDAAINIRSRGDFSTPANINDKTKENIGKDMTPANVGLLVGAGLEYNLSGKTSLMGGLQYSGGFLDVTDNPSDYKSKATLSYLRLLIGIYF